MSHSKFKKLAKLSGHDSGITSVAFSPGGQRVATGSNDGKLCVWDVMTGRKLSVSYGDPVLTLAWTWLGPAAVLCGTRTGRLAALAMPQNSSTIHGFPAHSHPVEFLSVQGPLVASGAVQEVRIWQWRTSEGPWMLQATLPQPSPPFTPTGSNTRQYELLVTGVQWTSTSGVNGPALLAVSYLYDGIYLFDSLTWTITRRINPGRFALWMSISLQGTLFAAANMKDGFDIGFLASGAHLKTLVHDVGEGCPTPISFVEGDQYVVGGSSIGAVNVWDVYTGHIIQTLDHEGAKHILALDTFSDGQRGLALIVTAVFEDHYPYAIIWAKGDTRSYLRHRLPWALNLLIATAIICVLAVVALPTTGPVQH